MARRKSKQTYNYECSLTGKQYTRGKKINNVENLVSVQAYYQLNPEEDDRPEKIKIKLLPKEE